MQVIYFSQQMMEGVLDSDYGKEVVIMSLVFFILLWLMPTISFSFHTFLGDDERTGYITDAIKLPLTKVWEVDLYGETVSSPVIYKDKVIVGSRNGYVFAIDLYSGQIIWDYSTLGFIDSTPYVSSDIVIVASMDGYVYAFEVNSSGPAEPVWKKDIKAGTISSPVVYKNKIYIGVGFPENSLKIIDLKTGNLINEIKFEKPINSAITLCNGRIIFGGSDGRIYSMDENGNDLKSYQTNGGNFTMKALSCYNSKIYALPGYDDRRLYKFSFVNNFILDTKTLPLTSTISFDEWNWQNTSSVSHSSWAVYMVAGSSDVYLFAVPKSFNDSNLDLVFSSFTVGSINEFNFLPTPLYSSGYIFLTSNNGFKVISANNGSVLWQDDENSFFSTPAISNGYVVVVSKEGKVIGYKASEFLSFDIQTNEIIYSTYQIKINALVTNATYWHLSYSKDGQSYIFLSSSSFSNSNELRGFVIYDWDISNIENSTYTLRLILGDLVAYKRIKINHLPTPPYNLIASDFQNDNCNRIILSWQGQAYDNFRIYRSTEDINFKLIGETTNNYFIDNYALCGTTYTYYVTSYDGVFESSPSNKSSAYSISNNPLNDSIPPAFVSDLRVLNHPICSGRVIYSFTQSGDDGCIGMATNYEILYSTDVLRISENKANFNVRVKCGELETGEIDKLIYGSTYYFMVRVYDYAQNFSTSNIATVSLLADTTSPMPPINFEAYDTPGDRGGRVTLKWEASYSEFEVDCNRNIYGYIIFRTTTSFDYTKPYAYVSKGVYGYIDNNAITGIRYFYKVCSYDSTNISCSDTKSAVSSDNFKYVTMRNGGIITAGESYVTIKPNTLSQDDYIIFYKLESENIGSIVPTQFSQSNFKPTSLVYKLESSNPNTTLNGDIEIKIVYSSTDVVNINKSNLRIYFYENGRWNLLRNSKLNLDENSITAYYNRFGYYAAFEYMSSGEIFDDEWIYTYPNPAKGSILTFKFVVNYNSDIEIKVYNVAGEVVREFETKASAGIINEIKWDIKDIASGVYVYVFKAKSVYGEKKVTKKFAVLK